MRCRSNALALGIMVLVITPGIYGMVGSVVLADDTAALTEISVSATAEHPDASTTVTSARLCNDTPVPVSPEPLSLASEQIVSLEVVQHWADLVADAELDQSDPALFADVKMVFPAWDVDSAEHLSAGWGSMEAAQLVWVRGDDDGTFVIGGLVYDNASTTPCRTGFLCWRADVDGGVIDSLTQVNPDGTIDEGTRVSSDYPYVDGQWIPADSEISSGITVQARLIELCDDAIPRPNDSSPAVVGFIEGTAVAASSGGDDACLAGRILPADLVEGAPVTLRDASTGEVVGTGAVTSTFSEKQQSTALPPPWRCTFYITATLSTTPDSITVQIGELAPLGPVSLDGRGGFTVPVPVGGDATGTGTAPGPDTTLPFSESTVLPSGSSAWRVFSTD